MNKESEVNLNDYRKVCEEVATFHYCLTPIEQLEDIINKIFEIGKENNFQPKQNLIGACFGYYPLDFLPKSNPQYKETLLPKERLKEIMKERQYWYDEPPTENTKKQKYVSIKNFITRIEGKSSTQYGQCKIRDVMNKYSNNYFRDYWRILNQIIKFCNFSSNSVLKTILHPEVPQEKYTGTIFVWDDGAPPVSHPVENFSEGVIRFSPRNPYVVYSVNKLTTMMSNENFIEKIWKRNNEGKDLDENDFIECLKDTKIII